MSSPFDVTCPNCGTPLKVPVAFAGKKVKCKQCQQVLTVPVEKKPLGPEYAQPEKSAAAAPEKKKEEEYQSAAGKRFAQEAEDDDGKHDYGVVHESDAPRCPHCVQLLDPPDAVICTNCGFDSRRRVKNLSRKVYKYTFGDWASHLGPAVFCALAAAALVTGAVICWINMSDWLAGSFLELDEKNEITGKNKFIVMPWCFSLWITIVVLFVSYKLGKFAFKRFAFDFKPPERFKK